MPRWLHNTFFVFILIISFGCAMSGIQWRKKEEQPTT